MQATTESLNTSVILDDSYNAQNSSNQLFEAHGMKRLDNWLPAHPQSHKGKQLPRAPWFSSTQAADHIHVKRENARAQDRIEIAAPHQPTDTGKSDKG